MYMYTHIYTYNYLRAFRIYSALGFVEAVLVLNPARLPNDTYRSVPHVTICVYIHQPYVYIYIYT